MYIQAEKAKKPGSSGYSILENEYTHLAVESDTFFTGVMDFIQKYTNSAWEFYEDQPAVSLALACV